MLEQSGCKIENHAITCKRLLLLGVVLQSLTMLAGCALTPKEAEPLAQSASAGRIGCPPSTIKITDFQGGFGTPARNWTATCNGKTYFCSGTASHGTWHDVLCTKQ